MSFFSGLAQGLSDLPRALENRRMDELDRETQTRILDRQTKIEDIKLKRKDIQFEQQQDDRMFSLLEKQVTMGKTIQDDIMHGKFMNNIMNTLTSSNLPPERQDFLQAFISMPRKNHSIMLDLMNKFENTTNKEDKIMILHNATAHLGENPNPVLINFLNNQFEKLQHDPLKALTTPIHLTEKYDLPPDTPLRTTLEAGIDLSPVHRIDEQRDYVDSIGNYIGRFLPETAPEGAIPIDAFDTLQERTPTPNDELYINPETGKAKHVNVRNKIEIEKATSEGYIPYRAAKLAKREERTTIGSTREKLLQKIHEHGMESLSNPERQALELITGQSRDITTATLQLLRNDILFSSSPPEEQIKKIRETAELVKKIFETTKPQQQQEENRRPISDFFSQ